MATHKRRLSTRIGLALAEFLQAPPEGAAPYTHVDLEALRACLKPADILLVEGYAPVSSAIKYFTQSTWSHAALFIGDALDRTSENGERLDLIEVNLGEGCIAAPLSKYELFNTRICRPERLSPKDCDKVVKFMVDSLGMEYDVKNVWDMIRFAFLPRPPVPARWRRRMLSFGSGDPTRAICSSRIAQAYHSVRYPILPMRTKTALDQNFTRAQRKEMLSIRHHSLFAPRDFDLSPYFRVIKPTLELGFDYRNISWSDKVVAADNRLVDRDTLG